MVNALGRDPEYQGKVLWLEHFIDDSGENARRRRWWMRKQADDPEVTSVTIPMAMVDSGRTYADGTQRPYESTYRDIVDEALTEPALVAIDAEYSRDADANSVLVRGTITNISDTVIGYDNTATLWYMPFEEERVIHVDWFVRRSVFAMIDDDIAPGGTQTFEKEIALPSSSNLDATQVVVLLEIKSEKSNGAYFAANSALAVDVGIAPPATEVPPTREPGDTSEIYLPVGYCRAPATP